MVVGDRGWNDDDDDVDGRWGLGEMNAIDGDNGVEAIVVERSFRWF